MSEQPNPSAPQPEEQPPRTPLARRRVPRRIFFFGVIAVIALVFMGVVCSERISSLISYIGDVLSPIIIGCVIAYLCNPILKFYEYVVFRKFGRGNLRRALSMLCTWLTVLGFFALVLALIVPELVKSITTLVTNYEYYPGSDP